MIRFRVILQFSHLILYRQGGADMAWPEYKKTTESISPQHGDLPCKITMKMTRPITWQIQGITSPNYPEDNRADHLVKDRDSFRKVTNNLKDDMNTTSNRRGPFTHEIMPTKYLKRGDMPRINRGLATKALPAWIDKYVNSHNFSIFIFILEHKVKQDFKPYWVAICYMLYVINPLRY